MRKFAVLLLCILPSLFCSAAEKDSLSFFRRWDARRYAKLLRSDLDSNYVDIPHQRWTLKTASNFGWNTMQLGMVSKEGEGYDARLSSAFDIGQGFYASWRGITLGASVKPAWFVPKLRNKDQKYSISVYGNRMGMAATIRSTTTLKGQYMSLPDSTVTIMSSTAAVFPCLRPSPSPKSRKGAPAACWQAFPSVTESAG